MVWNLKTETNRLSFVAAIESLGSTAENNKDTDDWQPLSYDLAFEYGAGIAGRTMKMNRLDRWDRELWESTKDQQFSANYYPTRNGSPSHCSLVSIPLHCPADEGEFAKNRNVYRYSRPFAVLNVGSSTESLPGSEMISGSLDHVGTLNTTVQQVQHKLNVLFFRALQEFGFRAT